MDAESVEGKVSNSWSSRVGGSNKTSGSNSWGVISGSNSWGMVSGDSWSVVSGNSGSVVSGISSWGNSYSIIADAGVVFADAGEGRVDSLGVVGHSGVAIKGPDGALVGSADGWGVDGYRGGISKGSGRWNITSAGNSQDSGENGKLQGKDKTVYNNPANVRLNCHFQCKNTYERFAFLV